MKESHYIEVKNLVKSYGTGDIKINAVDHVSFYVDKGEFIGIMGASGSGKTTLLNLLGGLDYADEGTVIVDGQDITRMKDEELTIFRRRNIGFVFQNYNLVTVLNVEKNITLPIRLDGNRVDEEYIRGITSALGIADKRKVFPNQLSGGQQQRVAIGRALITKPKLILADEPTGNLDSRNSQDVMTLLTQASRRFQQTILMITHNRNLTASVDRVIRVSDGILTDLGGKANEALS